MAEMIPPSPVPPKPARPLGVWVLTVYALMVVGVVPLLFSIYLFISGNAAGNEVTILTSLPISIGGLLCAVGAWKGSEKARIGLLVFVTLHYVFIAINNYLLMRSGQFPEEQLPLMWGRILRGFLYPVVYIWYFSRRATRKFYR